MGADGSFSASYTKLGRATKFIEELEQELAAYKNSNPASGRYDFSKNPPELIIELKGVGEKPGAIIGDAVHNMRTALDLMASELARLNGKSDKDVYFPFAASAEDLDDAMKRRRFDKTGPASVELLRQTKPYRGGNDALRMIHDLDIRDKHTCLILTAHTTQVQIAGSYNVDDPEQNDLTLVCPDIYYVWPAGEVFAGQRIIETLKSLVHLVDSIIKTFAAIPRD